MSKKLARDARQASEATRIFSSASEPPLTVPCLLKTAVLRPEELPGCATGTEASSTTGNHAGGAGIVSLVQRAERPTAKVAR